MIRSLLAMLGVAIVSAAPAAAQHAEHPAEHRLGLVEFPVACNEAAAERIRTGVAQLHHMMYEHARSEFEAATAADSRCAMAHWGIAMSRFQPLWHPTGPQNLERGRAAANRAGTLDRATPREAGYVKAVQAFFRDPDPPMPDRASDHQKRVRAWKEAQRALHEAHPQDADAAAFYALAEVSYAMTQFSPHKARDYTRERRAGALLERYLEEHPEHPGLHHYLIHAYDSPELAHKARDVAERYDQLAPETTHALHMPSHIFVRLGRWEETAELNERSAEAAKGHPVNGMTSLHYPHALDYMMYAYLQKGEDEKARRTLERVEAIDRVEPAFAAAYGIAAARARYYLERRDWKGAAAMQPARPDALDWQEHPGAVALVHYARGLGAARSGALDEAEAEHRRIAEIVGQLREAGNDYWAYMTDALGKGVEAWTRYERGESGRALALMREAAELEESMDKHPISPGEVLPVRELYGELLLREGRLAEARAAFEASLERTPNRRNALAGLERAGAETRR
jgi:tetratricopeptide (TPR) repeat protein